MMSGHQVVVIGAGPSGVAAAVSLRDRGLHPLLMDRADEVGASWRGRYDRLKLNTGRDYSHLPDRPYPKGTPVLPTRADIVEHLDRHAHEPGIERWLGTEVHRIDKRGTAAGPTLRDEGATAFEPRSRRPILMPAPWAPSWKTVSFGSVKR
jgi:cation diffusion facilitator CzcD-associated flavoprotein CzcO